MGPRPQVVAVHQRTYMPWLFEAARRAAFDLVLVPWGRYVPSPSELPGPVVACLPLDLAADPDGAVRALVERHAETPLAGLLACSELAVPFVAEVTARLGLPGLDRSAARIVRDKALMRERLGAAGLNSPSVVVLDRPQRWPLAAGLRPPVVVKPATGYSSFGVVRVDDPGDLESVVHRVWALCGDELGYGRDAAGQSLLVEEYVDGPELSVESLVHRGEVRVCAVCDKSDMPGPYFEEVCFRAPAALPAAVLAAVEREVVAAHEAFGVTTGATHTELRLRHGSEPVILEMGARIGGGGFLHHLVHASSGVDFAAEALRVAAGRRPECWDEPRRTIGHAGAYQVPVRGAGLIDRIRGLDGLDRDPRVDRVLRLMHRGERVAPYPAPLTAHPAIVLSHHESGADAVAFHDELDRTTSIEYADHSVPGGPRGEDSST